MLRKRRRRLSCCNHVTDFPMVPCHFFSALLSSPWRIQWKAISELNRATLKYAAQMWILMSPVVLFMRQDGQQTIEHKSGETTHIGQEWVPCPTPWPGSVPASSLPLSSLSGDGEASSEPANKQATGFTLLSQNAQLSSWPR